MTASPYGDALSASAATSMTWPRGWPSGRTGPSPTPALTEQERGPELVRVTSA